MILIDTTVLVYAAGDPHPLAAPARRLLVAVASGRIRATTTVEVIQEFAHIRARRRSRGDAVERARELAAGLSPLISTDERDLSRGLQIFGETRLGAFDAVLAGVAIERRLEGLVSADAAFGDVRELRWLSLDDPEVTRLSEGIG